MRSARSHMFLKITQAISSERTGQANQPILCTTWQPKMRWIGVFSVSESRLRCNSQTVRHVNLKDLGPVLVIVRNLNYDEGNRHAFSCVCQFQLDLKYIAVDRITGIGRY